MKIIKILFKKIENLSLRWESWGELSKLGFITVWSVSIARSLCTLIGLFVILVLVFGDILSKNDLDSSLSDTPQNESTTTEVVVSDKNSSIDKPVRDYEKEFYCDSAVTTVSYVFCMKGKFSRAAAMREWKQRKLEDIKYPEIDIYSNAIFDPIGGSLKIKKWRDGFDKARNSQCDVATATFFFGSASSASYSACSIGEEVRALRILDGRYERLISASSTATGIPDFEPTETDIQNIIKTIKYSETYSAL